MGRESEHIERAALAALHAAATPELVDHLELSLTQIGGAVVSVAGSLPSSAIVVNRAVGFAGDAADLRKIQESYGRAGAERYFLSADPDAVDDAMYARFETAGLEPARSWQKFSRGRDAVTPVDTDLTVGQVGPEHGPAFGAIVTDAFDLGRAAAPWLAGLAGSEGWHVFMSFDGEEPAGVGALYMKDGLGWSDFGATRPEFRRRGSQGALLAMRVQFALDNGCRRIFTCTGEAAPDDEQHSYRNILRMGFEKDYLRANYVPRTT